ncbi:substrate-binding and VWA domain-containing protein [Candidatus Frankia nodulisporulans]|uniref:substrate-binding and VWA domain-containing protein n=1 Tax=Candidatus Frankia nodulisporulans TaxID=2060052 RepID=UPI001CDBCBEA|nr:substrate-binding and VWA domain-containing protein [Candidatus Frankia nodulisporulans]
MRRQGPPSQRRRAAVNGLLILVPTALLITGATFAVASILGGSDPSTCADGTPRTDLTITTAPSLAVPVRALAAAYERAHGDQNGPCPTIRVQAAPSDRTLDAVARASPSAASIPDVWIPESSDWLALGQESASAAPKLPLRATTIAASPVVIAMPREMAQHLGWPEHHLTWAELAADAGVPGFWATRGQPAWGDFRFDMANPDSSAAGLRAVIGIVSAARGIAPADMSTGTFDQDRTAQATTVRLERLATWLPTYDSLLFDAERATSVPGGGRPPSAFPALESDVIAYNRSLTASMNQASRGGTLVAQYPSDGTFTASVPYIVLTHTSETDAKRTVAASFLDYLGTDTGRQTLSDAGLRTPAELAGRDDPASLADKLTITDGIRTTAPKVAGVDASDSVLGTARRFFRHARQRGAAVAVLDTSASMRLPLTDQPGRTRLQAASDTAVAGLQVIGPTSDLEIWQSAGALPEGHRVLSPMASLAAPASTGAGTHLDELTSLARSLRTGGATTLYSTVLAAVHDRQRHFTPGRLNEVIVITDGILDDPTGGPTGSGGTVGSGGAGRDASDTLASGEPTLEQTVERLHAGYDAAHPVRLIIIGCDPAANATALQRLAAATGGRAYVAPDATALFGIYADTLTTAH